MKNCYRLLFLLLLMQGVAGSAQAQNRKLYNMKFDSLSFEQFVQNLEIKTEYRFFYNAAELDSLSVTIDVTEKTLEEILEQVLAKSGFNFTIDPRNYIFITRAKTILTSLPPGFL